MEIFNKTEIQKANKALFLEKVQCFADKGIISIPEKNHVYLEMSDLFLHIN